MENIVTYIFEKLQLKSNKIADKLYVNSVDNLFRHNNKASIDKISKYLTYSIRKQVQYAQQFAKLFMNNNSNIKQLAETDNIDELVKYWWASVILKWDNAIIEFADTIEKFNTITQDELHQYVILYYKFPVSIKNEFGKQLDVSIDDVCTHYFELYDLEY